MPKRLHVIHIFSLTLILMVTLVSCDSSTQDAQSEMDLMMAGDVSGDPAGDMSDEPAGDMSGEPAGDMMGGSDVLLFSGLWSACLDEGVRSERHQYELTSEDPLTGAWRYQEERFGDGGCLGVPSTTMVEEGSFALSEPQGDGRPIDLTYISRVITPSSESAASVLGSVCTQEFSAGVPTNLEGEGCARLGYLPLSECPVRYDLIALSGDVLQFGALPGMGDLCLEERRPMRLGTEYRR